MEAKKIQIVSFYSVSKLNWSCFSVLSVIKNEQYDLVNLISGQHYISIGVLRQTSSQEYLVFQSESVFYRVVIIQRE